MRRSERSVTEPLRLHLHPVQHADDRLIFGVQTLKHLSGKVPARAREFQPALCLRCFLHGIRHLIPEDRHISPLPPRFGDIRADRPRGPSLLIDHRVLLLGRKALRYFKYLHRGVKCASVHVQISKVPDTLLSLRSHTCSSYLLTFSPSYLPPYRLIAAITPRT